MSSDERSYRVLQVLGAGGFGKVYRAEMTGFGGVVQQVALKVVRSSAASTEEAERRLRDEARMLGLLRHRAVVKVHGLTQLEAGLTLVMEYVEGVDCQRIVAHDELPVRVVLEVVAEVTSALATAWSAKTGDGAPLRLIHRDLKPANIRITADGEVKVLDFGAARAEFAARESSTQQYVVGSMRYMAPERLVGQDSPAVDVYAMGLVAAELISRDEPAAQAFTRPKQLALVATLVSAVEARLRRDRVDMGLARRVCDLIRRMLSFDADQRPSAVDLESACRELGSELGGLTLREWAPRVLPWVPPPTAATVPDEWTGKVLQELRSGGPRRDSAPSDPSSSGIQPRPQGAASPRRPPPPRALPTWMVPVVATAGVLLALVAIVGLGLGVGVWLGQKDPPPAPVPVKVVKPAAPVEPTPPTPSPAPKAPTTRTTRSPKAEPRPEAQVEAPVATPPAATEIDVGIAGDAVEIVASAGGASWRLPGSLPPGSYRVKARFGDGTDWSGSLTLRAGAVVYCLKDYPKCEAR